MATTLPAAASADRIQVAYSIPETNYGVRVTGGSGDYTELRLTGESLQQLTESVSSQEIRSDRQNVDVIRTGVSAGGDINFELSYATYDLFFQYMLQSTAALGAVTALETAEEITITAATGTFLPTVSSVDPAVGDWIKHTGAVNAGNNGMFKVATVNAGTSFTVENLGLPLVDEVVASGTLVAGSAIVNGTTFFSVSLQKQFTDLTNIFEQFSGMAFNTMALNVPVDGVITGSFGMLGQDSISGTSSDDGAIVAANSNEVMAAVEDVQRIWENTDPYGSIAFTLNMNNNLRALLEIATLGTVSVGSGTIDLTGTLQAYFGTAAAMDRYLNFTSSNIALALQDSAGNAYVIDIPEVKYTDGKRVAGGKNTDIIADLTWEAKKDPTLGHTIKIVKF